MNDQELNPTPDLAFRCKPQVQINGAWKSGLVFLAEDLVVGKNPKLLREDPIGCLRRPETDQEGKKRSRQTENVACIIVMLCENWQDKPFTTSMCNRVSCSKSDRSTEANFQHNLVTLYHFPFELKESPLPPPLVR